MDLEDLVHKTWNFALTIPALILLLPIYGLVRKTEFLVEKTKERAKRIDGHSYYPSPSSSPTPDEQQSHYR